MGAPQPLPSGPAAPNRFAWPASRARLLRVELADGARTTLHVVAHDLARTEVRVVVLPGQQSLAAWCDAHGVADALVGGFFQRPDGRPLGEVVTRGVARAHAPFAEPWRGERACLHVDGEALRIAARSELPCAPRGDLLQAGPLLVLGGRAVFDRARDREGFSAGAHQFDSDITAERHPRAALGLAPGRVLAVACDGRGGEDAGLTLEELADVLVGLGCEDALNLDGGGSTSLVSGGRLVNTPRRGFEQPVEPGGRPVSTALAFLPR